MPLVGLAAGAPIGRATGNAAEFVAAALLFGVGAYQLLGDESAESERANRLLLSGVRAALLLGLAVSVDELAVGFTLGLLRLPILPVVLAIGVQAIVLSQLGIRLGGRVRERYREGAERLAGVALIVVGVLILLVF